jgi:N-acetylglucosaminyl-diphospho-decaprenol L-rhamnosyltransferase
LSAVDLSVVIVSYNTRALLERCLTSLQAGAGSRVLQVIVVDNGSTDGSLEMVRERFPAALALENRGNLGFAHATNRGVERAEGGVVVWLNSDCETPPGSLATLVDYLDAHADVGVVGPRVLYPDGRVQPSAQAFPGPSRMLAHFLGLRALAKSDALRPLFRRLAPHLGRMTRSYLEAFEPGVKPRAVDWISGACLAARADVARRVGPLDEGYFMYCEDADWCQRVHAAGLAVHFVPAATVIHHVGASRAGSAFVTFHYYRSLLRYFQRWHARGLGALRAFLLLAFSVRGVAGEFARLAGRGTHPWWRLARLCVSGNFEGARA